MPDRVSIFGASEGAPSILYRNMGNRVSLHGLQRSLLVLDAISTSLIERPGYCLNQPRDIIYPACPGSTP